MRVNVRRWEMHRDGEGIAVVPSCTSKYFLFFIPTHIYIPEHPTHIYIPEHPTHITHYLLFFGIA